VLNKWNKIDILVNAAGITGITNVKTHKVDIDDFDKVMQVNTYGVFYFCRAVIPHMLKNNYGRIVNIASIAGAYTKLIIILDILV
jgi:3-oxoacyl-[acyl-carrier protein] reductase